MASKTGVLLVLGAVVLAAFTGGFTVAALTDTETVGVAVSVNETPATGSPATPGDPGRSTTPTATPNATATPTATPNATATPTFTPTPTPTPTITPTPTPTPTPIAAENATDTGTKTAE